MSVPVDSSVTRTSRCWPASRRRTFSAAVKEAELSPSHKLGDSEELTRHNDSVAPPGSSNKSRAVSLVTLPSFKPGSMPQVLHAQHV
ncbi:hypothetical protein DFH06DRAFT_1350208 [Mycena polygramma]|nr:hypothetical protein DFH06DRAFT_1350208 [Mycena polygramma]